MSRSVIWSRAMTALLLVAESLPPTVMQTTDSAPASNAIWKADWKSPGLQAAVLGNGAPGAVIISQKRSALRSTPVRYSIVPKVTRSGTRAMPLRAESSGERSDAESTTMATRGMLGSLRGAAGDGGGTAPSVRGSVPMAVGRRKPARGGLPCHDPGVDAGSRSRSAGRSPPRAEGKAGLSCRARPPQWGRRAMGTRRPLSPRLGRQTRTGTVASTSALKFSIE